MLLFELVLRRAAVPVEEEGAREVIALDDRQVVLLPDLS
jgi:hypothetical protein